MKRLAVVGTGTDVITSSLGADVEQSAGYQHNSNFPCIAAICCTLICIGNEEIRYLLGCLAFPQLWALYAPKAVDPTSAWRKHFC